MGKNVGDDFQTETKYMRNKSLGGNLDGANKPETYKNYPTSKIVQLPSQFQDSVSNFTEVIRRRKSIRSFSTQPLSMVDDSASKMMESLGSSISKISPMKPSPFSFNVKKTANRYCIPVMKTQLLYMLEAATLNPKSTTDARTLKGYSVELGLLDFLNPPWPDYVLEVAYRRSQPDFKMIAGIIEAAEKVGHKARPIEKLGVNPEKLKDDPREGVEILANNDLVAVESKETLKITDKGREYIKEVHKKPKKRALRKAFENM